MGRVDHDRRAAVDCHHRTQRLQGSLGQAFGDLGRLGEPVQHRIADLVHRACADRVVGAVADHLQPGCVEQSTGPVGCREEEGGQWLRQALEAALGDGRRLLDVDAVGRHAHQQVGAGSGAQLAGPRRQALGGGVLHVRGQRTDAQLVAQLEGVGLGHHLPEPRLGEEVVRAVHPEDGPGEQLALLFFELCDASHEGLGILGQEGAVAVALGQVLRPHRGAVGGAPPEPAAIDGQRHPAPHHGVLEAEQA